MSIVITDLDEITTEQGGEDCAIGDDNHQCKQDGVPKEVSAPYYD